MSPTVSTTRDAETASQQFAIAVHKGEDLEQPLARLAAAYASGGEPLEVLFRDLEAMLGFEDPVEYETVIRVAATSWADAVVSDFNRLTCADPLTGWSTAEHLHSHLGTLFAQAVEPSRISETHALLMLDIDPRPPHQHRPEQPFAQALSLAVVADSLDTWFEEPPLAQTALSPTRVALLVRRNPSIEHTAVELSTYVTNRLRLSPGSPVTRPSVFVLPHDLQSSIALVMSLTP